MKKLLYIVIFLASITTFAQSGDKRERIKALKVAFITEQLNLTEKESQKFWPVYNSYEQKTNKVKYHDIRDLRKEFRNSYETITNAEASALVERFNNAESRLYELRMELSKKLLDILPAKKIIQLKVAEEDFKKKMLDEYKKRRKEKS